IERSLAQTAPGNAEVEALQGLLEEEARQPIFLTALRGNRATTERLITAVQARNADALLQLYGRYGIRRPDPDEFATLLRGSMKKNWAAALHYESQLGEMAKMRLVQQPARLALLGRPPGPFSLQWECTN